MIVNIFQKRDIPMLMRMTENPRTDNILLVSPPSDKQVELARYLMELSDELNINLIITTPDVMNAIKCTDGKSLGFDNNPNILFYRGGVNVGRICNDDGDTSSESSIDELREIINSTIPPIEFKRNNADKLEEIKSIREYIAKANPISCCAYNKASDSYCELVNEVYEDITQMLGMCGCGNSDYTSKAVRDYLEIVRMRTDDSNPNSFNDAEKLMMEKFGAHHVAENGVLQFMAYCLDTFGMTDHGVNITCCWLTELGEVCLKALNIYFDLYNEEE